MIKYQLTYPLTALLLILISNVQLSFGAELYPCLTVINQAHQPLIVRHDPNWDDQLLLVDGIVKHALDVKLNYSEQLSVCGLWYQFGLNFYQNNSFAAIEVTNLNAKLTTLNTYPEAIMKYTIKEQGYSNLLIDFYALN